MKSRILFFVLAFSALSACKTTQPITANSTPAQEETKKIPESKTYRASNTRLSDIIHQELRVSFDWEKKYLFGEATLTIKPYFYATDSLYLNARGMEIKEVSLIVAQVKERLKYKYENDSLKIKLNKVYSNNEEYKIFIDYIAKPDELKELGGSAAITSDKGLYFINADGADKMKPKQIWTQGETQANSVWFPTIDSPNERLTQEIYITVDTSFVTLSNGVLLSSVVNSKEGSRTDYWKQTVPAAPYLTMMAISNFKVVKDVKWRGREVNYYVDPEYEKYAPLIFGHTPEMLEFFSNKLGVEFPWEKYSQVVAHDYVSGSMENASATLHGEFIQMDDRAYLDGNYEDYISHELFHQWFGDMVTCESWSNVPLNESFASYGEYLWNEYKFGRDHADYTGMKKLDAYLNASKRKDPSLIRFDYENKEDMFDRISYEKGSRILHMLRKYVGDEAFFKSLQLYLITNKFKPVEAHNLRLAFEEITGQDLNWYFNQWFFNNGYPNLEINYTYNDTLKTQTVTVEQKQDFEKNQLYKIPLTIDIYANGIATRKNVWITHASETFIFNVNSKPELVNVDAEKMLLCTKKDNHTTAEWIYQYKHAPLFLDRYEAVQKLSKKYDANSDTGALVVDALKDKHWFIRSLAVKNIETLAKAKKEEVKSALISLAKNDSKAEVRENALAALEKNYDDADLMDVYKSAVSDSSYDVMEQSLDNILKHDKDAGLSIVQKFENTNNKYIRAIISTIYSEYGSDNNFPFVSESFHYQTGGDKYNATLKYGNFLKKCGPETIEKGLADLEDVARNGVPWFIKLAGVQVLNELISTTKDKSDEMTKNTATAYIAAKYKVLSETIDKELKAIKEAERNKNLMKIYGTWKE